MLNKASGLKGLAGHQDMREVRRRANEGDVDARRALDVYAYRIRSYIGAYFAALPALHAVVFTAGIGENDADLRSGRVRTTAATWVSQIDEELNRAPARGDPGASTRQRRIRRALVVPTNEEAEIARQSALPSAGLPPRTAPVSGFTRR